MQYFSMKKNFLNFFQIYIELHKYILKVFHNSYSQIFHCFFKKTYKQEIVFKYKSFLAI